MKNPGKEFGPAQSNEGINVETVSFDSSSAEVLEALKRDRIVSFDLGLTEEEKDAVSKLEIAKNSDNFHFWGKADSAELRERLNSFLADIGENPEERVAEVAGLIARIGEGLTKATDAEAVWYEIRSMMPNDYFVTPRWHTDAKFFNPLKAHKLVYAVKGRQTRFGVTTDQDRFVQLSIAENNEQHGSPEDIRIREDLDSIVTEFDPGAEGGDAPLYLVTGDEAVIHSEPVIDRPRLFMSIIPGTEDEIAEMRHRMEQKWARKKAQVQA